MPRHALPEWANPFPDILSGLLRLNPGGRATGFGASSSSQNGSLTGARPSIKPFIVGLVPPDYDVNFVPVEKSKSELSSLSSGTTSRGRPPPGTDTSGILPDKTYPDSFYRTLKGVANKNKCAPSDLLGVLWFESGLNPARETHRDKDENQPVVARGLNMFTPVGAKTAGMSRDFWENDLGSLSAEEQLFYVDKYFKSAGGGKDLSNVDALYLANFAPAHIGKATQPGAALYSKPSDNYEQNKFLDKGNKGFVSVDDATAACRQSMESPGYKAHLARLKAVVGESDAVRPPGRPPPPPDPIEVRKPSPGVMTAGNVTDAESDDPLRQTGRNIRVATERLEVAAVQTRELQAQIDAARRCGSLLMLVNPREFTRNHEHTVDSPKVRRGHVTHAWLEKPLSITSRGVTAAQYAVNASGDGGLTHQNRVNSLSYRNLMSLVMLFKNNGNLFTSAPSGDPLNAGIPLVSCSVFIYYDGNVYVGSFDEFSITDSADKPHNLEYSWKFTARYEFDVSSVSDAAITRGLI